MEITVYDIKYIFLAIFSCIMVASYIASCFFCLINIYYNRNVIHPIIKESFKYFVLGTIVMTICGIDWIVHKDYMKIPLWQALGWGVLHVSLPYGYYLINKWICKTASIYSCEKIKEQIFAIKENRAEKTA